MAVSTGEKLESSLTFQIIMRHIVHRLLPANQNRENGPRGRQDGEAEPSPWWPVHIISRQGPGPEC